MFLGSKIITQLRKRGELFQYLWSMALEHTYVQKQAEKKISFSPERKFMPSKAAMFYCCTCSYLQWIAYQELF